MFTASFIHMITSAVLELVVNDAGGNGGKSVIPCTFQVMTMVTSIYVYSYRSLSSLVLYCKSQGHL